MFYVLKLAKFFIGCPHIVDYAVDLTPSLDRLLTLNEELKFYPRRLYAASIATAIRDINAEFADIRAQLCVLEYNIVSQNDDVQKRVRLAQESFSNLVFTHRTRFLSWLKPSFNRWWYRDSIIMR